MASSKEKKDKKGRPINEQHGGLLHKARTSVASATGNDALCHYGSCNRPARRGTNLCNAHKFASDLGGN